MRVLVVDPAFFTLPYDLHFARALAGAGAEVGLVGRPLRAYERVSEEPFALHSLFYRLSEGGERSWKTSPATKLLKGAEHALGLVALERLVARTRPDVVHVQWFVLPALDNLLLGRLQRRTRLVLTVHNASMMAHSAATMVGGAAAKLQKLGQDAIIGRFDRFVVHTERTRAHLLDLGVDPGRILVLDHPPLGLGESPAVPPHEPGAPVRILFFGSVKPYKGLDLLIEAGLEFLPRVSGCVIEIAGRPFQDLSAEKARIETAGLSDRFRFDLRYVPDEDLARYLAAADIVVLPYREIDASGALALAVAAGKPIVATAIGVFKESPVAEHLRLVPPEDAKALARALEVLVTDTTARERLAADSRTLQGRLVSWDRFARACLNFYSGSTRPS